MTDKSTPNDPYNNEHPENFSGSSADDAYQKGYDSTFGQGSTSYNPGNTPNYGSADADGVAGGAGAAGQDQYGQGSYGPGQYGQGSYGDTNYAGAGYPQGGYQAGGYPAGGAGYAGELKESNGMALWAMILGILAVILVLTIIVFPVGALLGLVALILGVLGIRRANKIVGPGQRRGMAITGIVLGILSLLGAAVMVALTIFGIGVLQDTGAMECTRYLEGETADNAAYQQCLEDALNMNNNN